MRLTDGQIDQVAAAVARELSALETEKPPKTISLPVPDSWSANQVWAVEDVLCDTTFAGSPLWLILIENQLGFMLDVTASSECGIIAKSVASGILLNSCERLNGEKATEWLPLLCKFLRDEIEAKLKERYEAINNGDLPL